MLAQVNLTYHADLADIQLLQIYLAHCFDQCLEKRTPQKVCAELIFVKAFVKHDSKIGWLACWHYAQLADIQHL